MSEPREIAINAPDCNMCMGCLDLAPEFFDYDDSLGRIRILQNPVLPEDVRLAMTNCPGQAIVFVDED